MCSEDSAARRGREAAAKVRDFNEASSRAAAGQAAETAEPPPALPSADAAFTSVSGPPAFLDPEAIRQLPEHQQLGSDRGAAVPAAAMNASTGWDISRMAPKLKKGEDQQEAGVISGKAVRYTGDEEGMHAATAVQIAMLGGVPGGAGQKESGKGQKRTAAMPVEEFLEKGVGGALLPRKRQERKDREKEKRAKGQSTHAEWKSEAEMVLRQQYD